MSCASVAAHAHDLSDLGALGWVIVVGAFVLVVWVLWRAVVLTWRPGEDDPAHIKRSILEDDGVAFEED